MNDANPQPDNHEEPVFGDAPPRAHTLFSNNVYDKLKFIALVGLPALATAVFGLGPLWDIPKVDAIVGTIIVIDTFLGMLLGVSTRQYRNDESRFDGHVIATDLPEEGKTEVRFLVDSDKVATANEVRLKVRRR
jgi:hypothetical protein